MNLHTSRPEATSMVSGSNPAFFPSMEALCQDAASTLPLSPSSVIRRLYGLTYAPPGLPFHWKVCL